MCAPKQVTVSIFLFSKIQTTITDVAENLGEANFLLPQLCTINISWPPIPMNTNPSPARQCTQAPCHPTAPTMDTPDALQVTSTMLLVVSRILNP